MQNKNILLTIFIACHIARFSLVTTNEDDDKASPSPDQSAEFKKACLFRENLFQYFLKSRKDIIYFLSIKT